MHDAQGRSVLTRLDPDRLGAPPRPAAAAISPRAAYPSSSRDCRPAARPRSPRGRRRWTSRSRAGATRHLAAAAVAVTRGAARAQGMAMRRSPSRRTALLGTVGSPFCRCGLLAAADAQAAAGPPVAHAGQRGQRLLESGRPERAARASATRGRRAYAELRAGRYADAAKAARAAERSDSLYNRGNALAHAGRLEAALAAYDAGLEAGAGDRDARHNRDLVARALETAEEANKQNKPSQSLEGQAQNGTRGTAQARTGRRRTGRRRAGRSGRAGAGIPAGPGPTAKLRGRRRIRLGARRPAEAGGRPHAKRAGGTSNRTQRQPARERRDEQRRSATRRPPQRRTGRSRRQAGDRRPRTLDLPRRRTPRGGTRARLRAEARIRAGPRARSVAAPHSRRRRGSAAPQIPHRARAEAREGEPE